MEYSISKWEHRKNYERNKIMKCGECLANEIVIGGIECRDKQKPISSSSLKMVSALGHRNLGK